MWSPSLRIGPRCWVNGFWARARQAGRNQRTSHAPSPSSFGTSIWSETRRPATRLQLLPNPTGTSWFSVRSAKTGTDKEDNRIISLLHTKNKAEVPPEESADLTGSFIPVPVLPSPSPFFQPIFSSIFRPLFTSLISLLENRHGAWATLESNISPQWKKQPFPKRTREQKLVRHRVGNRPHCPLFAFEILLGPYI